MDCGAVGTDCTVVRVGLLLDIGGVGGETVVRGTERNGCVGRRRSVCCNRVTVFSEDRYWVLGGGEAAVRGTERNGCVGRRRTVRCNRVTVFSEEWYWVLGECDSSERDREKVVCRGTAVGVL